ncbi:hypothetical protein [Fuerstiella marisgermanici]|uniref:Uncharacterized protein n=1 Tax=Fuerstiella marisgermanici TaxID=1891926 RepID=A0A1P8WEK7_9PLAN|nr:hypothetical protein [Fuerstiella marisgermanici]APZ92481.1 hypothetical protein Fuma_02092 [Fuerstiella marisgermanici]
MPESANVRSVDAIKRFQAAVLQFQEDARQCVTALELQLHRMIGWLERDRPGFWKREIENCYREMGEARIRLHRCKMRRVGDFRPTCYEEGKAVEKAKKDLEFAQKQVPVIKFWHSNAQHEANEYHGRTSQLTQILEREIPQLLALLQAAVTQLEAYGNVQLPDAKVAPVYKSAAEEPESTEEGDVE